jgi:hypothetical protein
MVLSHIFYLYIDHRIRKIEMFRTKKKNKFKSKRFRKGGKMFRKGGSGISKAFSRLKRQQGINSSQKKQITDLERKISNLQLQVKGNQNKGLILNQKNNKNKNTLRQINSISSTAT